MAPILLDGQIKAMVALLADQDKRTVDLVKGTLIENGFESVPSLLRANEIADHKVQKRIQAILGEIRFRDLEADFRRWTAFPSDDPDLEEGVFLIARFRYPDLDLKGYQDQLDDIASRVRKQLVHVRAPRTTLLKLNRCLFEDLGFRGNIQQYYDPDNSYINRVLDRKTGIPISLSVVYLLVAGRLGLPVTGVGLPGHFVLRYDAPGFSTYMDAFNHGQSLSRRDCIQFLKTSGYSGEEDYLDPSTNRDIVLRMLRNLVNIYSQMKADLIVEQLVRLVRVVSNDSKQDIL